MKRWLLMAALAAGSVAAAPLPALPGLLPDHVARPLLEQDPMVAGARAEAAATRQDAQLQRQSPYEFTARATSQRRRVDTGASYREWNVGLERPLRLPGKAAADERIAQALDEQADAHFGEAMHESARTLLAMWVEWAAAEQAHALAQENLAAARANVDVVDKRVRAGDAARLDASLARGELAEQERATVEARTAAAVAWAQLHGRFPGLTRQYGVLPEPRPVEGGDAFWRERILSLSDDLKLAEAARDQALGHAERARAERLPDPTLGIFTASEVGGRERLTGLSLSMPLPGARRTGLAGRAANGAEAARQAYALKRAELEAGVGAGLARAGGAYDAWQSARGGAAAMHDNARLAQRAYSLGEADLQSLLAARRQANQAAQAALAAQAQAVLAYGTLLVDAHLVWGLEHD